MRTCDDRRMPRPATGKTPVRNTRIPDETWLPALARAEVLSDTGTDAVDAGLRWYAGTPLPAAYELDFGNWPQARAWAAENAPLLRKLGTALKSELTGIPRDWLAVAAWLAVTRHPGDRDQQQRILAGHVLRYIVSDEDLLASLLDPDRFRNMQHVLDTASAIITRCLDTAA